LKTVGPAARHGIYHGPICYEFLRICTHPNILPRPWSLRSAWSFLKALFDAPAVGVLLPTDRHRELLSQVIVEVPHLRGSILHDVHTDALMREHGFGDLHARYRLPPVSVFEGDRSSVEVIKGSPPKFARYYRLPFRCANPC
jgi:hypothetical protein